MNYKEAIKKMLKAGEARLIVNLDDLRDYDRAFCDGCAYNPLRVISELIPFAPQQTSQGSFFVPTCRRPRPL